MILIIEEEGGGLGAEEEVGIGIVEMIDGGAILGV
jgi:hypothetical protein